ncbi:MAG: lamin tail domain-containing protein [Bacteroidetes bacterium]|uniref:Lamin tail domain-containing protein n=1 Tax=Candidatus Cryptobacteroides merdigallinarum TaxID=2840770 RepID=A0A9D9HEZ0_9BACT|nr:lamin tail domain-containing protein [Candidatus Cryptobacteroides merdigallinarum]
MKSGKILAITAMIAGTSVFTGCKDDQEPGMETSDVTGVFINEVCSGGMEWIELYNSNGTSVSLAGYHLQDDKGTDEEYIFPEGATIEAESFYVLEEGTYEFGISGSGDSITLLDEAYRQIDAVTMPEMDDYYTYARTEDGGSSWEITEGGTKGRSNSGEADGLPATDEPDVPEGEDYSGLRLNEINGNDKFIELYNTSDADINLAGVYFVKDDEDGVNSSDESIFTFGDNTSIAGHGYLTIWSSKSDNSDAEYIFDFGLSADKSVKIELFTPGKESLDVFKNLKSDGTEVWGEDDGKYDSKDKGSFARETDGTGDWYIMSATEGQTNAGAQKADNVKIEW